jgi:two-component sensor histidine kinase
MMMTYFLQPSKGEGDASFLLVAELLHRTRNDYARIISFASLVSARSCDQDTKMALREITDRLHNAAETQRLLSPPMWKGTGEFTESLTRLCGAISASFEIERRGIALLLTVDELVFLDAGRSWRACLIIFELISNACRHAFGDHGGRISVAVTTTRDQIICRVSDDGRPASTFERGLGTSLVDALATALDGFVERQFTDAGTSVAVSFPADPSRGCCELYEGGDALVVRRSPGASMR